MGSSVSYITQSKTIGKKYNTTQDLTSKYFSLPASTYTGLGSGFKPFVNDKSSKKNYSISTGVLSDKDNMTLDTIVKKMNETVYLPNDTDGVQSSYKKSVNYYNRFKTANPNKSLQKGFAHVFFVRPNCNLMDGNKLLETVKENNLFSHAWNHSPEMIKELVHDNGIAQHDFMLSISNASASFSLNDEYINSDSYGKTYTGYKIAYGKNNVDSKTAGNFRITFDDDRNLHIYQEHRLWVEYINAVYRGELAPRIEDVFNKILDYASSCYYFVTAEDGETIIFWSKYYGVFPTEIPSTQYSWAAGNVITQPQLDIGYMYSFKEDFNPFTFVEFNYNSRVDKSGGTTYVPVYDKKLGHSGRAWVGAPFVELIENPGTDTPYIYKLRFKSK